LAKNVLGYILVDFSPKTHPVALLFSRTFVTLLCACTFIVILDQFFHLSFSSTCSSPEIESAPLFYFPGRLATQEPVLQTVLQTYERKI
jgi:hypothetical protein